MNFVTILWRIDPLLDKDFETDEATAVARKTRLYNRVTAGNGVMQTVDKQLQQLNYDNGNWGVFYVALPRSYLKGNWGRSS